jgi:ADP-heptose:LPS heptosyltransferase
VFNSFYKIRINSKKSITPSDEDIKNSNKVLFSVFTRYGDTIISLVVIKEFIEKYPDKKYLIFCSEQMQPYVLELLPGISCLTLKKRSVIDLIRAKNILKKSKFDIGLNPWSFGLESSYLISFCLKFEFYKDFIRPKEINHYEVVRKYLNLDSKEWFVYNLDLEKDCKKILICPQSTDKNRSISFSQLDELLIYFNSKYYEPEITIAAMDKNYFRVDHNFFCFKKSSRSSKQFIKILKHSDLVVCSDSGPLHIANAFKKAVITFFNSTNPELVLNSGEYLYLKGEKLNEREVK